MKLSILLALLSVCASVAHAGPVINIGSMYDYLDAEKTTYLKRVYNNGDQTAFVRINIHEMLFDEKGNVTEQLVEPPADATQRRGLVASPARLIVPVKGMQGTRLLYLGARDEERYYRVRFVPVMPEKEDQFAVTDEERETYKNAMSAGVNVMTGYGSVFFVRPEKTVFDTKVQDEAAHYRVTNAGNSSIEVDEFKDCSASKESDCAPTTKHIVRPGNSYGFDKEAGRVYRFNLVEGKKSTAVELK
jgi:hypothetical protein